MFNEGPIPPEMMPSLRDLIADLEGYRKNTPKEEAVNYDEDNYQYLALILWMSEMDEKIQNLKAELSNISAAVGFLALVTLLQFAAIIYLLFFK